MFHCDSETHILDGQMSPMSQLSFYWISRWKINRIIRFWIGQKLDFGKNCLVKRRLKSISQMNWWLI